MCISNTNLAETPTDHALVSVILGNTFPFAVFIIYGTHWGSLAFQQDPTHGIASSFENYGGPNGAPYNSSQSFHNITM